MKFYLAPMEGVTGYIYRNAYADFWSPMDKYFAPFIVPQNLKKLSGREIKDILSEYNQAQPLIPQILTNDADDFIQMTRDLKVLGYDEVNLNLGCPSGTVVSKGRGAGFLAHPFELQQFLDKIFADSVTRISVKTRLGMADAEEFEALLNIYNRYEMEELIIHARVRQDMYKNRPNLDMFAWALENSKNPLVYNGDIFDVQAFEQLTARFGSLKAVMLGRGVIARPGLLGEIKGEGEMVRERLRRFHDRLYHDYAQVMSGERNLLFRMKELWAYMGNEFADGQRYLKRIRKAQRLAEYQSAVDAIFRM